MTLASTLVRPIRQAVCTNRRLVALPMRAASLVRRAQLLAGADRNNRLANHDSINDLRGALERLTAVSGEVAAALEGAVNDAVKAGADVLHEMPRAGGAGRVEALLTGTVIPKFSATLAHALFLKGLSTNPHRAMIGKAFGDADAAHLTSVLAGLADLLDSAAQAIFAAAGARNPLAGVTKPSSA